MGSRLTGKFRKMIGLASGIRGQRPVEPQNYAVMLRGFPLNKDYPLETALKLATDVQANPARNGATLTLDQFVPDLHLTIPAGASHFRVVLLVLSVSEHNYDPSVEGYLPVTASLNGLSKLEATPFMPVRGLPAQTLTLTADLPGLPTMTSTEALMVLVGVEFHQIVSGAYYILESGNAMNVVEVY